ncbi:ribonuclease HII [Muriicola soli]|uniref:Ribonuclease HII n=1 Tax=Muriicola soli TaxID=2507538 RepID=A0A411EBA7_9FLAO|nr:ribonuclease HII [Muriicola soli]QBA64928.1 ribonuclease HII [Muriicola soli]
MRSILAIGFIAIFISACNSLERTEISLEEAIPSNAALILKVKDPASLKRDLRNCDFIPSSSTVKYGADLLYIIGQLKELQTKDEGYLVAIPNSSDSLSYVYISEIAPKEQTADSVETDSIRVEPELIEETTVSSVKWFTSETGNLRFSSIDSLLVAEKKWLNSTSYPGNELLSLLKNPAPGKEVSLFLKSPQLDSLNSLVANKSSFNWTHLANSLALDLRASQDILQWTGVGTVTDSTPSLLSLFSNTQPVVNTLASLAPESADGLLTISFTDEAVFRANQQQQFTEANDADALFGTTEEVGLVFQGQNKGIIINTFGALSLSEFLQESRSSVYDYQGKEIGVLASSALLEEAFPAFISNFKATHYTVLDNAFIFCEDRRFIELMIRNINSEKTFETSAIYESARSELAEASSMLFLADGGKLTDEISRYIPKAMLLGQGSDMPDHVFAFQLVSDRSFSHLNTFVKRKTNAQKKRGVAPLFTVELGAPLATNPQFVTDHRNDKKEIVVQDTENNLYLISTSGKVLWKKKLEGRVQGRIEQIDLYKNGRLQLAFTTSNQFLVLDRNGKEVAPFDMSFSGPLLNPLSVFDYEGNRNYRFVVTQGSDVRMYNGKGKIVDGFKYTKAETAVLDRPRHFRIGSKDYLVFKLEDGSLRILNRVGDTRVAVDERIDFSENDVYLNNNKFIITDKTGTLFAIDTRGKITKTRFNLSEDHGIDATTKTLSVMNDNELTIKGNKASLDLGVYTKPRIFYIYDKIYVSVTDIQTQRAYLFDSNAISFSGFPVYAASPIDLSDLDNDRRVEIVSKFEENSVIVYTIN